MHNQSKRYIILSLWLLAIAGVVVVWYINARGITDPPPVGSASIVADVPVPDSVKPFVGGRAAGVTLQETGTVVTYAPTVLPPSPPDATQQASAEETAWTELATMTAERTIVPQPIVTNEATVEPVAVTMDVAWGGADITQVPIALDDKSMFIFHSVDPNGRFVVGAIAPRTLGSSLAKLVIVDAKSGRITEVARYIGPSGSEMFFPPSQTSCLFGSDTDGKTVVWNERSSIRAYDISTGIVRTLAEMPAQKQQIKPAPIAGNENFPATAGFCAPKIDNSKVIWREYTLSAPNIPLSPARVMKADLPSGDVTTLSSFGDEPVVAWPYAGWIEYPKEGEGVNDLTFYYKGVVTLLNLETGSKISLHNTPGVVAFGLTNDAIVYSRTSGQAFITDLNGGPSRLISGSPTYPFVSISLNERVATWVTFPPIAFDRAQERRVYLKAPTYPGSVIRLVKGHILAVQAGNSYVELDGAKPDTILPNDQIVYLVDTNTLPTSK